MPYQTDVNSISISCTFSDFLPFFIILIIQQVFKTNSVTDVPRSNPRHSQAGLWKAKDVLVKHKAKGILCYHNVWRLVAFAYVLVMMGQVYMWLRLCRHT